METLPLELSRLGLLARAREIQPWMTRVRRRLHQIPELAYREFKTAGFLAAELTELDLKLLVSMAGSGIVAELDSGRDGPVVALRSDMDALAIEEKSALDHVSQHPGWAHSCGHDGHMACLLGACRLLRELGGELRGRVRMLFQPAEEHGNGAQAMIADGALDPLPRAILSLHGWPGLPVGSIGSRAGPLMAASDQYTVRLVGRGGHGARPQDANSPIRGLAPVLSGLMAMTNGDRVVSPCVVQAGQAVNVIPDVAVIKGTLRTLSPESRRQSLDEMARVIADACAALGLTGQLQNEQYTPPVSNAPALNDLLRRTVGTVLGQASFVELAEPSMGSEDFGFYLERCPGLMFRLGLGEDCPPLHNSAFDFRDEALPAGAAVLAGMAIQLLRTP